MHISPCLLKLENKNTYFILFYFLNKKNTYIVLYSIIILVRSYGSFFRCQVDEKGMEN